MTFLARLFAEIYSVVFREQGNEPSDFVEGRELVE
jgi:hypothetical protein